MAECLSPLLQKFHPQRPLKYHLCCPWPCGICKGMSPVNTLAQGKEEGGKPQVQTLSFPAFYNAIHGAQGFLFPAHLFPLAVSLEDERIPKLMVICGPGSGKSIALSTTYPTFAMGRNPAIRILGISGSEDLPRGFIQAAMGIVGHSPQYRKIFPHVRPDKELGWSTERGMFITGHPVGNPDATYYAAGLKSKTLTGLHGTLIILDDIHTYENSISAMACEGVKNFYYNTIVGRADPSGARFILAGRRWSEWDIYGHLMESGDWVTMRLPAERPASSELYWDIYVPPGMECCWTEGKAQEIPSDNPKYRRFKAFYGLDPLGQGFYWPSSVAKRSEYFSVKRNQPATAAAVYQGAPGARESGIFSDSDFERRIPLGNYDRLSPSLLPKALLKPGSFFLQAWDTASKTNFTNDYSVCITALLIPCLEWHKDEDSSLIGEADQHFDALIVDVVRKKLEIGSLSEEMRAQHAIWKPKFIAVEDKASGIAIIQALKGVLPIVSVKADKSKRARAVIVVEGGTASVQGWMRMGRVSYWAEAPWLDSYIQEMKDFSGDGSGLDDCVDATVHLLTQAILMGSEQTLLPSASLLAEGGIQSASPIPHPREGQIARIAGIGALEAETQALSPFESLDLAPPPIQACLNCRRWDRLGSMCELLGRKTVAFDYCERWTRGQAR